MGHLMKREPRIHQRNDAVVAACQPQTWRFTGHIYYLLDTLKLSYSSQAGLVTYENVNEESLASLCREISRGNWTQPRKTADIPALFTLSVCAVSWEKRQGKLRVKAIPDAAALRFEDIDYQVSEAKFQSQYRPCDDITTPMADVGGFDKYIKRVRNLSTKEFLQILTENNQALPIALRHSINVTAKNFEYRFTHSERVVFSQIIGK